MAPADAVSSHHCSVLEHFPQGDLWHFLRQLSHVTNSTDAASENNRASITTVSTSTASSSASGGSTMSGGKDRTKEKLERGIQSITIANSGAISYYQLLEFIDQVAAGMKYLESRNIVHKDLAARYVLIQSYN